jgi:hypothetical protein
MTFILLGACSGPRGSALPEGFEEAEVEEKAMELITLLCAKDYDAVYAQCGPAMKSAFTPEFMEANLSALLDSFGSYESHTAAFSSTKDDNGNDLAVVVIQYKTKNRNSAFTISFEKSYLLAGLYIR